MKMVIDRAIVEQALGALEEVRFWHAKQSMAVTNLRAALAQPQIDPVDEYRKGFIAGQIDMRDREEKQAEPLINQCGETCERAKLCAVCAAKLAEPVQVV